MLFLFVGSGEHLTVESAGAGPSWPLGTTLGVCSIQEAGLGTDGKWEASRTLEMFCAFEKAKEVFFSPRDMTSSLDLFFALKDFKAA